MIIDAQGIGSVLEFQGNLEDALEFKMKYQLYRYRNNFYTIKGTDIVPIVFGSVIDEVTLNHVMSNTVRI